MWHVLFNIIRAKFGLLTQFNFYFIYKYIILYTKFNSILQNTRKDWDHARMRLDH